MNPETARPFPCSCWLLMVTALCSWVAEAPAAVRTRAGLQALYDFSTAEGDVVKDRSGVGKPLDLKIADPKAVRRANGLLEVRGKTLVRSKQPASKIIEAVRRSGAITIEAWIHPAKNDQSGPARIMTLSQHATERNFTLGQDGDRYDVRLRTTKTSNNGLPSVSSPGRSVETKLAHVVYTRDRSGRARLYLNGKQSQGGTVSGDLSNWNRGFHLALANELSGDRPWQGRYHLVAIYSRDLKPNEVGDNYRAGLGANTAPAPLAKEDPQAGSGNRVGNGLVVYYDFSSSNGSIVQDRSGAGQPVNLKMTNPKAVRRTAGSLEIRGKTIIQSEQPPTRLIEAIRRSGEITIESWIRPANTTQNGPARIVTLSRDSGARNFTIGQERDRIHARLRTTRTSGNGVPELTSTGQKLKGKLTHLVYTRDRSGRARLYINGQPSGELTVGGELSNWDKAFRLALGNEVSNDRPWLGTFYLVAIYNRDLSAREVGQNFKAGARPETTLAQVELHPGVKLFESRIAPLFAQHCLECHDSTTHKGKLDLSRKATAFAGGKNGQVIVPGKSAGSALWEAVESDEMPDERPPLSVEEKKLLKEWIDGGAAWSLELIDPAAYLNDNRVSQNWLRRLTRSEYIETVRVAVGVEVAEDARRILPPDLRADGFANTAYNLNVDLGHVSAYAELAAMIVDRMDVLPFAQRYSKSRKLTDDSMRGLIEKMGKWILRGPLESHEVDAYRGISTTVASAGGNFKEAVSLILEAMLQSPRFIYRIENQRGDGTAWPVSEHELASRLSYIIWGGPPDEELARAADAGELSDPAKVDAQVKRMLQDPLAMERAAQFIYEWLNLARMDNLRPSPEKFPNWDPQLAADMRAETLAFFKDVAWKQNRPLSDLLNTQITFATPRLAKHYGLKPREGEGLARYDLAGVPGRGGLLTQGSVLTVGGDAASMVTRGLFVLHDLLRGVVKDPPPCVDTTPVPTRLGFTQRSIAEARIANKSCGGCHAKFEPLAFGLEKFDGLGAYHEKDEHGNQLRDDGEILFPGAAKPVAYQASEELMNLLAGSDRVRWCLTWKVTQFAMGRPLVSTDLRVLERVHELAQKGGGTYASLIAAIVMSDLVQTTRTEIDP